MPQLFDFTELFQSWGSKFQRIPKDQGHYDYDNGGEWVPGFGAPEEIEGILVPLTYKEINSLQFEPGGTFTREDQKVYVQNPYKLLIDDRIRKDGKTYRVLEELPYEEHAGFNIYIAKRVDTKGRDPIA